MAYFGSGEHPVKVRVLGPDAIDPGVTGLIRLHLPRPLPLMLGDRFILRESGRVETVGGGEVLDIDPVLPASKARPDRSVDRVIAERGRVFADTLEMLTGERRQADVGGWVVAPAELEAARVRVGDAIAAAGPLGLDLASIDDFERAVAETLQEVEIDAGRARVAHAADPLVDHPYVMAAAASPFAPPPPDGIDRGELRELVRRGELIEEDGVHFAASAIGEAALVAARLLADQPDGVTVAELRDAWGTTRKFALPLLARLDGTGVTRRRGDLRIGGPRLPELS